MRLENDEKDSVDDERGKLTHGQIDQNLQHNKNNQVSCTSGIYTYRNQNEECATMLEVERALQRSPPEEMVFLNVMPTDIGDTSAPKVTYFTSIPPEFSSKIRNTFATNNILVKSICCLLIIALIFVGAVLFLMWNRNPTIPSTPSPTTEKTFEKLKSLCVFVMDGSILRTHDDVGQFCVPGEIQKSQNVKLIIKKVDNGTLTILEHFHKKKINVVDISFESYIGCTSYHSILRLFVTTLVDISFKSKHSCVVCDKMDTTVVLPLLVNLLISDTHNCFPNISSLSAPNLTSMSLYSVPLNNLRNFKVVEKFVKNNCKAWNSSMSLMYYNVTLCKSCTFQNLVTLCPRLVVDNKM